MPKKYDTTKKGQKKLNKKAEKERKSLPASLSKLQKNETLTKSEREVEHKNTD